VGLKAGPIFVAAVRENGYLLISRHCSDVDPNVEITLLDVTVPSDQAYSELGAVDSYPFAVKGPDPRAA
jgi:hypothetical protein